MHTTTNVDELDVETQVIKQKDCRYWLSISFFKTGEPKFTGWKETYNIFYTKKQLQELKDIINALDLD